MPLLESAACVVSMPWSPRSGTFTPAKVHQMLVALDENNKIIEMQRMEIQRLREQLTSLLQAVDGLLVYLSCCFIRILVCTQKKSHRDIVWVLGEHLRSLTKVKVFTSVFLFGLSNILCLVANLFVIAILRMSFRAISVCVRRFFMFFFIHSIMMPLHLSNVHSPKRLTLFEGLNFRT